MLPAVQGGRLRQALRYLRRLPLILVWFVFVTPLCLLLITPWLRDRRIAGERLESWAIRRWSQMLLRLFGLRLRVHGRPLPDPVLFVANHVSWLDIEAMHATRLMAFVAKWEISRWPVVGWLASRAGTIYLKRGQPDSMAAVMHTMVERLRAGRSVGVFPEGTTGRGERVGPFHARIFQVAVETGVPIQPVALRYGQDGRMNPRVPFTGKESFVVNLLRVIGEPLQDAEVHFLEPLYPSDPAFPGRRELAQTARSRIVEVLHGSGA